MLFSRDQVDNDLSIIHIIVGKERANGTVHQTGDEYFVIGEFAFATEEVARNAAGRSEFFLVIHRKGEEGLTFAGLFFKNSGGKNHGIAYADNHGAVGLRGQLACFDGHLAAIGQLK